jgi:hypothetical protein
MSEHRAVVVLSFDEADPHRLTLSVMDEDHPEAIEGMRLQPHEARFLAKELRQAAEKCDEVRRDEQVRRARSQ